MLSGTCTVTRSPIHVCFVTPAVFRARCSRTSGTGVLRAAIERHSHRRRREDPNTTTTQRRRRHNRPHYGWALLPRFEWHGHKREGLSGTRSGLFFQIPRIADEYNATWLFLENASGQCANRLDLVVGALHDHGFDCRWRCLSASDLGAPHERNRWFLLAHRCNGTGTARVILQSVAEIMQAARRFGWHVEKGQPARAKSRIITAAECPGHKARNHAIGNALAPF